MAYSNVQITKKQNKKNEIEAKSSKIGASKIEIQKKNLNNTKLLEKSSEVHRYSSHFEIKYPIIEKFFPFYKTKQPGLITSRELQHCFELYQNKHYSLNLCQFMVRLLDLDKRCHIELKQFESLYENLKNWINAFKTYDRHNSGELDENELDYALRHIGIPLSLEFIRFLIKRKNPNTKKMMLNDFLIVCIQMQEFTRQFETFDPSFAGNVNIPYDDYILMMLKNAKKGRSLK